MTFPIGCGVAVGDLDDPAPGDEPADPYPLDDVGGSGGASGAGDDAGAPAEDAARVVDDARVVEPPHEVDAGAAAPEGVVKECVGSADPLACCDGAVARRISTSDWEAVVSDPSLRGCCTVIVRAEDPWSLAGLSPCCALLGHPQGPACTPWGPPVPPPLGDSVPRARRPVALDLRSASRGVGLRLDAPTDLLQPARATWLARMVNEQGSAVVFERLAVQLREAGFGPEVVQSCASFAAEERRHGVLCGAVVEALGGEAHAAGHADEFLPAHADASRLACALRNVLSVCCLSETVAVALIGAERLEMPDGELRDLLTEIYADEVGHARFGWRLLAGLRGRLGSSTLAALNAYLPTALAHLEAHELAHLPATSVSPEGAALGLCSGDRARDLLYATIEEVIVPQLEALGLDARAAWGSRRALAA